MVMTREKEIKNEAKLKCYDIASEVDYKSSAAYDGFVMGAKWADKTMLDNVYKWLNMNLNDYITESSREGISREKREEMIKDLRKDMEE